MTIKAVLFDLDGTLVDSSEQHVSAWHTVFAAHGDAVDRATLHGEMGKGADQLVPALLPGADAALAATLGDEHGAAFAPLLPTVRPFPGARDLLRRCVDAGQMVVAASSASRGEVEHYLDLLDARGLVTAWTCADDVARTKPAPDIFAAALARIAPLTAAEVVVVGDSPYDVVAARGCAIAAVALRSGGFADNVLLGAGAVAVYDDAATLLRQYADSPLAASWRAPNRLEHADLAVAAAAAPLRDHPLMTLLGTLSDVADQPPLLTLCSLTLLAGVVRRSPRLARTGGAMLASALVATWLKGAVKHRVNRTRPRAVGDGTPYAFVPGGSRDSDDSSFPSGHTAGAVAAARSLARAYPTAGGPAGAATALVAALQLPRGKHYPTDLVAGAAIGLVADAVVALAIAGLAAGLRRYRVGTGSGPP